MPRKLVTTSKRVVRPGQRVHVADPDVGLRAAVLGDRDEPRGGVDAGAGRAPRAAASSTREAGAAGDVEQPVAGADAEVVVQGDVLRQFAGSLSVAKSAARRPQPSSTPRHCSWSWS